MDITDSLATYLYLATQGLYCIMDVTSTVVLLIFLSVYVFLHASQLKVAPVTPACCTHQCEILHWQCEAQNDGPGQKVCNWMQNAYHYSTVRPYVAVRKESCNMWIALHKGQYVCSWPRWWRSNKVMPINNSKPSCGFFSWHNAMVSEHE